MPWQLKFPRNDDREERHAMTGEGNGKVAMRGGGLPRQLKLPRNDNRGKCFAMTKMGGYGKTRTWDNDHHKGRGKGKKGGNGKGLVGMLLQ